MRLDAGCRIWLCFCWQVQVIVTTSSSSNSSSCEWRWWWWFIFIFITKQKHARRPRDARGREQRVSPSVGKERCLGNCHHQVQLQSSSDANNDQMQSSATRRRKEWMNEVNKWKKAIANWPTSIRSVLLSLLTIKAEMAVQTDGAGKIGVCSSSSTTDNGYCLLLAPRKRKRANWGGEKKKARE